nr:receptor-like protein kinase HERK 1 [Tanacetum cinerariifolium]
MASIKEFDHLKIPLKGIESATNSFGTENYIGGGGFGKVYRGGLLLSEKLIMVAVKRLDSALGQGPPEFWKEIMMLSRYKHENLVSLLGFCDECGENILVYEYLSNKSLDVYLSSKDLSWSQRLNICIGAARGLQYLHDPEGTQQRVLHRDIKSANILLDKNWKAKAIEIYDLVDALHSCKQAPRESVSAHVLEMKGYMDQLHALGKSYDNDMAINLINRSLNKDFSYFVRNFNMHCVEKAIVRIKKLMLKIRSPVL